MTMKAIVRYDTEAHTVELRYKNFLYVQMTSVLLKEITSIQYFDCGYFIADTNYGEEYFDFQYSLESEASEGSVYAKRFLKELRDLKAKDIKIEKIEHIFK